MIDARANDRRSSKLRGRNLLDVFSFIERSISLEYTMRLRTMRYVYGKNRGGRYILYTLSFIVFFLLREKPRGIGRLERGVENVGENDDKGDEAKHVRDACFNRRYQYDSSPSNPLYPPLMEQSSDCTKNRCVTETIPTLYL